MFMLSPMPEWTSASKRHSHALRYRKIDIDSSSHKVIVAKSRAGTVYSRSRQAKP